MKIEYCYYFYDYGILRKYGLDSAAIKLIESHDWYSFCRFKKFVEEVFNCDKFFPDVIFEDHIDENDDDNFESSTIPFNKENFMKITFTEFEAG